MIIKLKYPTTCRQCGTLLKQGETAKWYRNGTIYGLVCHDRQAEPCQATAEPQPQPALPPTEHDWNYYIYFYHHRPRSRYNWHYSSYSKNYQKIKHKFDIVTRNRPDWHYVIVKAETAFRAKWLLNYKPLETQDKRARIMLDSRTGKPAPKPASPTTEPSRALLLV